MEIIFEEKELLNLSMEFKGNIFKMNNYIKDDTMELIVKAILAEDNPIKRDVARDIYLLALMTDIEIGTNEVDVYREFGIMDYIASYIENYDLIDYYVREYESMNKITKVFLDNIINKIDVIIKKIPNKEQITSFIDKIEEKLKANNKAIPKAKIVPKPKVVK